MESMKLHFVVFYLKVAERLPVPISYIMLKVNQGYISKAKLLFYIYPGNMWTKKVLNVIVQTG